MLLPIMVKNTPPKHWHTHGKKTKHYLFCFFSTHSQSKLELELLFPSSLWPGLFQVRSEPRGWGRGWGKNKKGIDLANGWKPSWSRPRRAVQLSSASVAFLILPSSTFRMLLSWDVPQFIHFCIIIISLNHHRKGKELQKKDLFVRCRIILETRPSCVSTETSFSKLMRWAKVWFYYTVLYQHNGHSGVPLRGAKS